MSYHIMVSRDGRLSYESEKYNESDAKERIKTIMNEGTPARNIFVFIGEKKLVEEYIPPTRIDIRFV